MPLQSETKTVPRCENHCLSETMESLRDLDEHSVKLDEGRYTTKGTSVSMSERCLQALIQAQKRDHKKNDLSYGYVLSELPDRFRIRIMPMTYIDEHGKLLQSGHGGNVYDVAKDNGAVTWYGGWK
jgi:hypothetical protein